VQAQKLEEMLQKRGKTIDRVLNFQVSHSLLEEKKALVYEHIVCPLLVLLCMLFILCFVRRSRTRYLSSVWWGA
jgi:hypothetical protein